MAIISCENDQEKTDPVSAIGFQVNLKGRLLQVFCFVTKLALLLQKFPNFTEFHVPTV